MRRPVVFLAAVLVLTSCLGSRVEVPPAASPAPAALASCTQGPELGTVAFEDPKGRCLPVDELRLVQCDLDLTQVLVRDEGTSREQRFLGGPFRVAVGEAPSDAKVLATSTGGLTVYVRPGAQQWIWVQDAIGISRWLSLPSGLPWEGRAPAVAFIGDSITDGAAPYLTAALPGWTTTFDAVIGRPSSGGLDPAATVAATVPAPDAVVVELGTNDGDPNSFRTNAQEILSRLRDIPFAIWQTAHGPMDTIPLVNATIRDTVTRYPTTSIADWDKYVTADMLVSDGVHPTTEHEGAMASLEVPLLDAWRAAVEGRGATRCLASSSASPTPS